MVFAGVAIAAPAPDGGAPGTAGPAPDAAAGTDAGTGGKSVAAVDFAGADATAGGGRDSFYHASHNISAENEKTTNRMRRWVSMTAWVSARRFEPRGG